MQPLPNVTGAEVGASSRARVLTRQDADRLPVYEVVERWLHRDPAFSREHDPEHHLEELALMTVAAEWLTLWQPISMHRAILAGATPDQVAAAAGRSVRAVFAEWQRWADLQRMGRPGEDEYAAVRARFVGAGSDPLAR